MDDLQDKERSVGSLLAKFTTACGNFVGVRRYECGSQTLSAYTLLCLVQMRAAIDRVGRGRLGR